MSSKGDRLSSPPASTQPSVLSQALITLCLEVSIQL